MRGTLSLFSNLIEQPAPPADRRKGRSVELHTRRNECLIDRYVYYLVFSDKRYESIIGILSNEFFLSPVTVPEVLQEHVITIREIKKSNPTKNYFSKKWNHLNW